MKSKMTTIQNQFSHVAGHAYARANTTSVIAARSRVTLHTYVTAKISTTKSPTTNAVTVVPPELPVRQRMPRIKSTIFSSWRTFVSLHQFNE